MPEVLESLESISLCNYSANHSAQLRKKQSIEMLFGLPSIESAIRPSPYLSETASYPYRQHVVAPLCAEESSP